jgi:hypothetical protein
MPTSVMLAASEERFSLIDTPSPATLRAITDRNESEHKAATKRTHIGVIAPAEEVGTINIPSWNLG